MNFESFPAPHEPSGPERQKEISAESKAYKTKKERGPEEIESLILENLDLLENYKKEGSSALKEKYQLQDQLGSYEEKIESYEESLPKNRPPGELERLREEVKKFEKEVDRKEKNYESARIKERKTKLTNKANFKNLGFLPDKLDEKIREFNMSTGYLGNVINEFGVDEKGNLVNLEAPDEYKKALYKERALVDIIQKLIPKMKGGIAEMLAEKLKDQLAESQREIKKKIKELKERRRE